MDFRELGSSYSEGVFGHSRVLRAAIYSRVSTAEQRTIPAQTRALTEYVARRGWQLLLTVEDVASGAKQRTARERILQAARRREIDVVVVFRLDRWGRSLVDLVATLHELLAIKVGFVSLTETLDFTTPAGRALAGLLSVFAEFERELLRERVKSGILEARRNGQPHGRPATARRWQEEITSLLGSGLSKSAVARQLNIGRTSVRRYARLAPGFGATDLN